MTRQDMLKQADRQAAELGARGGPVDLLAGAADVEAGDDVRAEMLAHAIATAHSLMLRLSAAANALLDWSRETAADAAPENADTAPADTTNADLAAARIAAASSRLMEQVRLGLAALRRCRPGAQDDGLWLAFHWLDDRCSDEELARRIAEAKAANADAAHATTAKSERPLSSAAAARRAAAAASAARLAEEARVATLARAMADESVGAGFVERVFAHELGAAHALMMRLAGAADRAIDRSIAVKAEPATALRLTGVVARLGDRCRRGHLTLVRLAGTRTGGPSKPLWGGSAGGYDPDTNPGATAGHGVDPSDSGGASEAAA